MKLIHAIYEDGVFRPTEKVDLPDRCEVEFEPRMIERQAQHQAQAMAAICRTLSRSYETGNPLLAERHGEHQP